MKYWFLLCFFSSLAHADSLRLSQELSKCEVDRQWASGTSTSIKHAALELSDNNKLLDRIILDSPLARLERIHGTYFVTVDLTAEAGTYNGPLTNLVQVVNHQLKFIEAAGLDGSKETIRLSTTGKSVWKIINDDILSVSCQPQDKGFVTIYRRYHPTRNGWIVRERLEPGLWESDGEFPGVKHFPR